MNMNRSVYVVVGIYKRCGSRQVKGLHNVQSGWTTDVIRVINSMRGVKR